MPQTPEMLPPPILPPSLNDERTVLIISDGRAGHENQSLGVAQALGVSQPEIMTLTPVLKARWLHWLPVWLVFGQPLMELRRQLRQVPGRRVMLIGTGWKVSRINLWLKQQLKKDGKQAFVVQMMRPAGRADQYDVVALPRHSLKQGTSWAEGASNVLITVGAPNRITPALLRQEGDRWRSRLQHCHEPRLAVLIGGDSRHGRLRPEDVRRLMKSVLDWANATGGSLLVSTSRRSGPQLTRMVEQMLDEQRTVPFHFWQPDDVTRRDNPYFAYLALADGVVVTAESVAMVSEAASAGKPVYLWGDIRLMPKKFQDFYALLMKQQRLAGWLGRLTLRLPREGLAEAALVAGFVQAKWDKGSLRSLPSE